MNATDPTSSAYDEEVRSVMLDECPLAANECDNQFCPQHHATHVQREALPREQIGRGWVTVDGERVECVRFAFGDIVLPRHFGREATPAEAATYVRNDANPF